MPCASAAIRCDHVVRVVRSVASLAPAGKGSASAAAAKQLSTTRCCRIAGISFAALAVAVVVFALVVAGLGVTALVVGLLARRLRLALVGGLADRALA